MISASPFQAGKTYNRRQDIHAVFGGQRMGGIATPTHTPYVFLFTGKVGKTFGYLDGPQDDGVYWYTGEGQHGDMRLIKGNAAIRDHQKNGKSLLLFEATSKGFVRFVSAMAYLEHHFAERPDANGALRQAIIFHLETLTEPAAPKTSAHQVQESSPPIYQAAGTATSMGALRQAALAASQTNAELRDRLTSIYKRSIAVKQYALARAKGICEGCQQTAPFHTKRGSFLEMHHTHRVADGGPDHPDRVITLCPNCHRRAHYAQDAQVFNQSLRDWLQKKQFQ